MTDTITASTFGAGNVGTIVAAGAGIPAIEAVKIRIYICQCQKYTIINLLTSIVERFCQNVCIS